MEEPELEISAYHLAAGVMSTKKAGYLQTIIIVLSYSVCNSFVSKSERQYYH